jgi:predicted thioesterase
MMTIWTSIRIQHLGAYPQGSKVRARASLKKVDG